VTAKRGTERILIVVLMVLLGAIGVVLVSGAASGKSSAGPPFIGPHSQFDGATLPPHLRAANFSLLDQDGHRVTLSSYRGRVVILTFMHSLCKGACPLMAEQIKGALNDLPNQGKGIPAIAISVDPKQDTRANRRKFLAKYQMTGRLEFLNGPLNVLWAIWHHYYIEPEIGPTENHSAYVMLIDKRGFWRIGFPVSQLTPDGLAHDIGVLEHEPA
jgi:protein SCO1/2